MSFGSDIYCKKHWPDDVLIPKSNCSQCQPMICDICGDYITADSYQKVISSCGYINIHDECMETWIKLNR